MNQLLLSKQSSTLQSTNRKPVKGILLIGKTHHMICIRQGHELLGFKNDSGAWRSVWREGVFKNQHGSYPTSSYPWFGLSELNSIIILHPDGVRIYQSDETQSKLELVAEDGRFHEANGFGDAKKSVLLFGNIFTDANITGVLARDNQREVTFYAIGKDSFLEQYKESPLFALNTDFDFSSEWTESSTEFFITDFLHQKQKVIALHFTKGIKFFQFDESYQLKEIFKTSLMKKTGSPKDRLFFADLTHQIYQDILHLTTDGLFVYQFDSLKRDYNLLHHHSGFSESNGWQLTYTDSIVLTDFNGDGRDELIFTGSKGLTAFTFDVTSFEWKMILDPSNLSREQRFSSVVGLLPFAISQSSATSLILQDKNGKVQLTDVKTITKTPKRPTTLKPKHIGTTKKPSLNHSTSKQIARRISPEKPVLRWSEQFGNNVFKDVVDLSSGQVRFAIPLIDTSLTTPWNFKLELNYQSQSLSNNFVGEGWSVLLAQDYIIVDNRGSIYFDEVHYYLVSQGYPIKMNLKSKDSKKIYFELVGSDNESVKSVEYDVGGQYWIIDGKTERIYYGESTNSHQLSLKWPNWQGQGLDKEYLQPYIQAWHLSSRESKHDQQKLQYKYVKDDGVIGSNKFYTKSMRLHSISDNNNLRIVFNYDEKTPDEFTNHDPVDEDGNINFPVPLCNSHFLRGYELTTAQYSQELQFVYTIDENQRLLNSIVQPIKVNQENVLQLEYNKFLLKSCTLSSGLRVDFTYKDHSPVAVQTFNTLLKYPVSSKTKIAYGPHYAVLAYRELDKIVIRIMNHKLTKTIKETSTKDQLNIENFNLHAFADFFIIHAESKENQAVHLFEYQKDSWTVGLINKFAKDDVLTINEKSISVADKNLIRFYEKTSNWTETSKISFEKPLTRLAQHNQLIVGYDDSTLWLVYKDGNARWTKTALSENLEGFQSMLNRIEFESAQRKEILNAFNNNGLQIFKNCIAFSAMHESNGQLILKVHMFLLNEHYQVKSSQVFELEQDNIYKLSQTLENNGNSVTLKYKLKNNRFYVYIDSVSGPIVEEIEKIKDVDSRRNAMEEALSTLNKHEDWQKMLKGTLFINFDPYVIQMREDGVICGGKTLIQNTGIGWQKKAIPKIEKPTYLGDNFILESSEDNKVRLYNQGYNRSKIGNVLIEFAVKSGMIINRYPDYIAYQTENSGVQVLTFKDQETVGKIYTFKYEHLQIESDNQKLVTVIKPSNDSMLYAESFELRIRPVKTLRLSRRPKQFVSQTKFSDKDLKQTTGYDFKTSFNSTKLTETITVVPGGNKEISGWYDLTQTVDLKSDEVTLDNKFYEANGKSVTSPTNPNKEPESKSNISPSNPSLLFDKEGKWLISDFSPFKIADEMVDYYGFEAYERNENWVVKGTNLIAKGFSFSGENYLKLERNSSVERNFIPAYQSIKFFASCWVRTDKPLNVDSTTSIMKAKISTMQGSNVTTLQAQVKRKQGDWFYLELLINFEEIKHRADSVNFKINLIVSSEQDFKVDLDHIRFYPVTHDFQATVYNPMTGQVKSVLQANGLVIRKIFNRYNQEIAVVQEDGNILSFGSQSQTGELTPSPIGAIKNTKPASIIFEPEYGFYENFDTFSMRSRWKVDNSEAWKVAPGQLMHEESTTNRIESTSNLINGKSIAIRCFFALESSTSSLSFGKFKLSRHDDFASLILQNGKSISSLPTTGEIILMIEESFLWIWVDGVLVVDLKSSTALMNSFYIEAQGKVLVEDLIIMKNPQLRIEYSNSFGYKTQVIQLMDPNTIQVTETLYDELGRDAITTKPTRITRNANEPLLTYRNNFVKNRNPQHGQSVWKTGKLQGEANDLNRHDEGFAYIRTEYAKNPINEKIGIGLPGPKFSIAGPYSTKLSTSSNIAFLDNLFPTSQGYRQSVEVKQNGNQHITVFNQDNLKVALYEKVPSFNHLLTTYEYDDKKRLIKMVPPIYHEKVNTACKFVSWKDIHLTEKEVKLQQDLATFYSYDSAGNLVKKVTPDIGTTEFLYNSAGQMRFIANQNSPITYMNYDSNGQLSETGIVENSLTVNDLRRYVDSLHIPTVQAFQRIDVNNDSPTPSLRGRIKTIISDNEDNEVIDKIVFDSQQQITSKTTKCSIHPIGAEKLTEFRKEYSGNKLRMLNYPVTLNGKPLNLVYERNRLGKLTELRVNNETIASFDYNPDGHLKSETFKHFNRNFNYNSPGFLEKITDPFLTQEVAYTENGYGQSGNGDGIVMQTRFNATWSDSADGRWFQVGKKDFNSNVCVNSLKQAGVLADNQIPVKLYTPKFDAVIPLVCNKQSTSQVVARKQLPRVYGHRYAYGNHQELVKAKYFTDETIELINPLQPKSFAEEIEGISIQQSEDIWQLLVKSGFIKSDQQNYDPTSAVGKFGKSLIRRDDLLRDLKELNPDFITYINLIENLILQQKDLTLDKFVEIFLQWTAKRSSTQKYKKDGTNIGKMLMAKGYLSNINNALDPKFLSTLSPHSVLIPQITKILTKHFSHALNTTPFDVESYNIDANGNHRHFFTGFDGFEFKYKDGSNRIESVKKDKKLFLMQHDGRGNVIQAQHKNIESIEYHPVSQRTTRMKLTDGRVIKFFYDAQGERVLKQVFLPSGKIKSETFYLRDEKGRVLVDQRVDHKKSQQLVTAYIYGPRGLLGFIRNDQFYAVTTDHAGSIRLVIQGDQVVAAYDYLPYGELMRSFGNDPQAQIMYRYTGQEFDEETGLYNYHARLYDPAIGRFYQIDPQAQYPSPYKYAGNSPVSMIDPDGEIALLILGITTVVGVYLGGAAVNDNLNPIDWDFSSGKTWVAMALGGVAGFFLPQSFLASSTALGAYLEGAAANDKWNPHNWNYKDPGTWFGIGFGAFSGFLFSTSFAASTEVIGVYATFALGGGGAYLFAASANDNCNPLQWKWDRPKTWNGLHGGFVTGAGLLGVIKDIKMLHTGNFYLSKYKTIFILGSGAVGAYGMAAWNNKKVAFWRWNYYSSKTYAGLVSGASLGFTASTIAVKFLHPLSKLKSTTRNILSTAKLLKNNLINPNALNFEFFNNMMFALKASPKLFQLFQNTQGRRKRDLDQNMLFIVFDQPPLDLGDMHLIPIHHQENDLETITNLPFLMHESADTSSKPFSAVGEFSVHHLHGGLQLLDLLIRKFTGEHHHQLVASHYIDDAEAILQRSLERWEIENDSEYHKDD